MPRQRILGGEEEMLKGGVDEKENELGFEIVTLESLVSYLGGLLLENCREV